MAASARRPTYLVLGSGGIKGFQILGALHILEVEGYLTKVKGYAGSSIGAMISLLLVCGYKPHQIIAIACSTSIFTDFANITSVGDKITEMKSLYGVTSTSFIRKKLEQAIIDKYGRVPSLQELWLITGLEFWTVSYDLDREQSDYISHKTYPDMDAITAVLLSINIPLIFYRLTYQDRTYIDGAFCDPLPILPFDDGTKAILAIYISSERKLPADIGQRATEGEEGSFLSGISYFVGKLTTCAIDQLRKQIVARSTPACQFLELRSNCIDTVGITLSATDKVAMILKGSDTAQRYLKSKKRFALSSHKIRETVPAIPDHRRIFV